jgi:hypothetical protein
MTTLLHGLITGVLFGFLLQRCRVSRYDKQVGALRLMDMTIFKFMLTGIITAMVFIYILKDLGVISLRVMPLSLGANVVGGLVFGIGWAMLGYCPGTSAAALGEGRLDAGIGIIGILFGAAIYAEIFPLLKGTVLAWGKYRILTLPQLAGLKHWFVIPFVVIGVVLVFRWFEKKGL